MAQKSAITQILSLAKVYFVRVKAWGVNQSDHVSIRTVDTGLHRNERMTLKNRHPLNPHRMGVNSLKLCDLNHQIRMVYHSLLKRPRKRNSTLFWTNHQHFVDTVSDSAPLPMLDQCNHGCANVVYRHRLYNADWTQRLPAPGAIPGGAERSEN